MTPFRRQKAPDFWADKEQRWRKLEPDWGKRDPFNDWAHQKRSLGVWFHERVRDAAEPRMCAYCDGPLTEQSRETIDHFLPEHVFPELSLSWDNLYPACDRCNSTYKRTQWSCQLVRPDIDPVETYFDLDELDGSLLPSPQLDRRTRAKVRLTIRVFGLNEPGRCKGRLRVIKEMINAWKTPRDDMTLEERASQGPYRFVARKFLESLPALQAPTSSSPATS